MLHVQGVAYCVTSLQSVCGEALMLSARGLHSGDALELSAQGFA